MRRFLGIGITILLILAALFMPDWWFALRDAASQSHVQGEALAPLMVAQLDRSYENDVYERLSTYFEAGALGDVICSSKEIDAGSEALWENIGQAEQNMLMQILLGNGYISPYGEKWGEQTVVDKCTQYVLIRESDGQILLVANDIHLRSGDGHHTELLIDGLDGTVYYAESEEKERTPMQDWTDEAVWEWQWILSESYGVPYEDLSGESEVVYDYGNEYIDIAPKLFQQNINSDNSSFQFDLESVASTEYFQDVEWIQIFGGLNSWLSCWEEKDVYCCQLHYGDISDCWSMETEKTENDFYCIRLGFPRVVNFIPEMAERIELAEYNRIYDTSY